MFFKIFCLVPDIISNDLYPSKRVLSWSPDCSIFAIATTHGHIACYDLLASNLFVIKSVSWTFSFNKFIMGIFQPLV